MKVVIFNADGEPIRVGTCPRDKVTQQARDGETAVEWPMENGDPLQWRLRDGVAIKAELP